MLCSISFLLLHKLLASVRERFYPLSNGKKKVKERFTPDFTLKQHS